MSTRVPTRAREALRRAVYGPARAAASLPRRSLRFKSRRPRHARPGSSVILRAGAPAAEAAGMVERGSGAAGGGLPLEERRDRVTVADPACADASHAGAGPSPASPGRNFNPGHHPSFQGLRTDGPGTAEAEEAYMARWGFGQERHDVPRSAVGKDSDEALHRTIQIMPLAEVSNPATVV